MPVSDVLIVGAGAAGLRAGDLLADAGLSVVLLEARDRLGGRIHTLQPADLPAPVELGAEFIHGRPRETLELLQQTYLAAYDVADKHYHLRGRRLLAESGFWSEIERVMNRLSRRRTDRSFDDFLRSQRDLSPAIRRLVRSFVEGFDAADTTKIGVHGLELAQKASEKIDGDLLFRPIGGYGRLIDSLADRIQQRNVKIHLNAVVRQIQWSPRASSAIADIRGESVTFDARKILLTIPLGVLKSSEIAFSPAVPGLADALACLEMGPVIKVIIRFRRPFWESRGLRDLGFFHSFDLPFPTWWTQLPLRLPLLTGWAGGPSAGALALLGKTKILDAAIESLSRSFSASPSWIARQIEMHWLANWPLDPYSRGAYSYVATGGLSTATRFPTLGKKSLFFAGEHTEPAIIGTVAGALASSRRAAKAIRLALAN